MRLIAIGDIHGEREKLESLLAQIQLTQQDQLVFLGDYIDRGPDSKGVIDCLIQLGKDFPRTVFLRGNHEQMVLDILIGRPRGRTNGAFGWMVWLINGGKETLASYGVERAKEIPQSHIDFIEKTKRWHRQNGFFFVHAGYDENYPLEDQEDEDLLWTRYCPPGKKEIHVVGHTPCDNKDPFFEEGRYNLDTGATFGGRLTACDVLTREIWQA
ncbi:MAG: metallophosphoesterase family protein [Desulfuromonadales bacterium]